MGQPLENDDVAKEVWQNLADATALSTEEKTALRAQIDAASAAQGALADSAVQPGTAFDSLSITMTGSLISSVISGIPNFTFGPSSHCSSLYVTSASGLRFRDMTNYPSTYYGDLTRKSLTANRAWSFRDMDGDVAFTSDIDDHASATDPHGDRAYADSLVVGLLDDRGNYNASGNVFPSSGGSGTAGAILKGDLWTISVAGTLGGVAVTAGDVLRALTDTPGQTAGNWVITENNLGYVPQNTAGTLALSGFAGITGTLADINIASAATWNAKQNAITFGTGVQAALAVNINGSGGFITDTGSVVLTNKTLITPTIAQINGSNSASGNLTLQSTTDATKGKILIGTSAYDELNNRLGIGKTSPAEELDLVGTVQAKAKSGADNVWFRGINSSDVTVAQMSEASTLGGGGMLFTGVRTATGGNGIFFGAYTPSDGNAGLEFRAYGGTLASPSALTTAPVAKFSKWNGSSIEELMTLSVAGNLGIGVLPTEKLHVAGNILTTGALITTPQVLTGAGAVNLTTAVTALTSSGVGQALTLANGANGQIKTIAHVSDGGSGVLTPTTAAGFTTITFTNAGDAVILQYFTTGGWHILGFRGVVIA